MMFTLRNGLLAALLFVLTGCFQQAGESLQSTGSTAAPTQIELIVTVENSLSTTPDPQATEVENTAVEADPATPAAPSGPVTSTLPPITIIFQPTDPPLFVSSSETAAASAAIQTDNTDGTAVRFITPGIPLGPGMDDITDGVGGALTVTPSGLMTPTTPDEVDLSAINPACIYVVESGDTLYRIALANDTTVDDLKAVNPDLVGDNPVIQPSQELILPDCDPDAAPAVEIEPTVTPTDVAPVIEPAAPGGASATPAGSQTTYTVRRGDTLFIIAQRYGTTVAAIVAANNLSNPDRLSIGQELIIPQP